MNSLLTNESAMVALNTLRSINKDMSMVQKEISTGKSVADSRDNASIWAVSTVMQSDVDSFEAISSSLNLGASTVGVARGAAETITNTLQEMKDLIVAAQESNVDRNKIQTDIDELEKQITTVVDAAQFNGLNLMKGTENVNILASLNRAPDGSVSTSNIQVARQDLSINNAITGTASTPAAAAAASSTAGTASAAFGGSVASGDSISVTVAGTAYTATHGTNGVTDLDSAVADVVSQINAAGITDFTAEVDGTTASQINFSNASGAAVTLAFGVGGTNSTAPTSPPTEVAAASTTNGTSNFTIGGTITAGETYTVALGDEKASVTARTGETSADLTARLATEVTAKITGVNATVDSSTATQINIENTTSSAVSLTTSVASSSGLADVSKIDVTTTAGAQAALGSIEGLIQKGIDAAASFGSIQKRIDNQSEFVKSLSDAMKQGIGALTDADMEEASARLQSLQVQQQLGTQALSIANQRPQSLLGLFR